MEFVEEASGGDEAELWTERRGAPAEEAAEDPEAGGNAEEREAFRVPCSAS